MEGYYLLTLKSNTVVCESCEVNCKECSSIGVGRKSCRYCKDGFYLNSTTGVC